MCTYGVVGAPCYLLTIDGYSPGLASSQVWYVHQSLVTTVRDEMLAQGDTPLICSGERKRDRQLAEDADALSTTIT